MGGESKFAVFCEFSVPMRSSFKALPYPPAVKDGSYYTLMSLSGLLAGIQRHLWEILGGVATNIIDKKRRLTSQEEKRPS